MDYKFGFLTKNIFLSPACAYHTNRRTDQKSCVYRGYQYELTAVFSVFTKIVFYIFIHHKTLIRLLKKEQTEANLESLASSH